MLRGFATALLSLIFEERSSSHEMEMELRDTILRFWFGDDLAHPNDYATQRKFWFGKNPDLDRTIRDRFLDPYHQAVAGLLSDWQTDPLGCVALVLLLDQFPRNMFRDQPQAFATDAQALAMTQRAIAQGLDQSLHPLHRLFLYLPLEHSENLAHQAECVQLMEKLAALDPELQDPFDYALRHQAVIERFGRFPHRNRILERESTPEEVEFLKQPGSSF
jgi:uncharacterized protein (DUF924 family)